MSLRADCFICSKTQFEQSCLERSSSCYCSTAWEPLWRSDEISVQNEAFSQKLLWDC